MHQTLFLPPFTTVTRTLENNLISREELSGMLLRENMLQ
jgi:hypothetical protein